MQEGQPNNNVPTLPTRNGGNDVDCATFQEIKRLREEIDRLYRAERGEERPKTTTSSTSRMMTTQISSSSRPPTILPKDKLVLLEESPSSSKGYSSSCCRCRKVISTMVGIGLFIGLVLLITNVVSFMKDNNIQLVPSPPGNMAVSMEELATHNTVNDCWVALHGYVYDLTQYAQRHPGGSNWVTDLAGTDGTVAYDKFHSTSLLRSVQGDIIGPMVLQDGGTTSTGNNNNNNDNNGGTVEDTGANGGTIEVPPVNCNTDNSCISMEELATHNTADDCWMALYGNVYDLTNYARRHPGGARVVTNLAGMDGTSEYQRFHSQGLLGSIQADTWVGVLEGASNVPPLNGGPGGSGSNGNGGAMFDPDSED